MPVHPYIHFPGTCREALGLYARAFDSPPAQILSHGDRPADAEHPVPEAIRSLVMHATLTIHGTLIMAADSTPDMDTVTGSNITLMVNGMAPEEIDRAFAVLAEGGRVLMAPQRTFWSPRYAQLTDRHGIGWQLSAEE